MEALRSSQSSVTIYQYPRLTSRETSIFIDFQLTFRYIDDMDVDGSFIATSVIINCSQETSWSGTNYDVYSEITGGLLIV
jgi:hypothetical protein